MIAAREVATARRIREQWSEVIDRARTVDPVAHLLGGHGRRGTEAVEVVVQDDRARAMLGFAREDRVADPRDPLASFEHRVRGSAADGFQRTTRRTEIGGIRELDNTSQRERDERGNQHALHRPALTGVPVGRSVTAASTSRVPIHT